MSAIPWMAQMFGWLNDARTRASRSNRSETLGIDDKDWRQDLDGDITPERHVARAIDLAHASRANAATAV